MKIAVLAWGSLLWSPRELAVDDKKWNEDGPYLPIEFSRIASDGRLTLVLDKNFDDIRVYWKTMALTDLKEAIQNLKLREQAESDDEIGYINCQTNDYSIRMDIHFLMSRIKEWAQSKSLDAVIWTDLLPKFYEKTGKAFGINSATDYLNNLEDQAYLRAREYIEKAPIQTQTRFRKRLEEALNLSR